MSARADLCGGRSAMIVPTATSRRNEAKPLPYTSALIQVEGYWQPGYIVDQDSLDNYAVFLPNSPQANEGRVLLARKNQIRIISSITANQLNASLERMGEGLLSDLAIAEKSM
jgi:hypothetical protein